MNMENLKNFDIKVINMAIILCESMLFNYSMDL